MSAVLEIRGLSKRYRGNADPALASVSLRQESAELLALVGESGSGKTTLLRLLAGLEIPDRGRILLNGKVIFDEKTMVPPEQRGIGLIFQDYALFPHFTVSENIGFGLRGQSGAARQKRIEEMLDLVQLPGYQQRYPHQLSGGEKQRIAIARALAPAPGLLLMDEPFSNLDESLKAGVRAEVQAILRQTGTAAILVTHDSEDALAVADKIAVLRAGHLQQFGNSHELYHHPQNLYVANFFGPLNLLPAVLSEDGRSLKTDIGTLPTPPGSPPKNPLQLLIRPHQIEICENSRAGALNGEVLRSTFHGRFQEIIVRIDPANQARPILTVHGNPSRKFTPGDRISIYINPEDIWLLPKT